MIRLRSRNVARSTYTQYIESSLEQVADLPPQPSGESEIKSSLLIVMPPHLG